jgi:hypothetical protein
LTNDSPYQVVAVERGGRVDREPVGDLGLADVHSDGRCGGGWLELVAVQNAWQLTDCLELGEDRVLLGRREFADRGVCAVEANLEHVPHSCVCPFGSEGVA